MASLGKLMPETYKRASTSNPSNQAVSAGGGEEYEEAAPIRELEQQRPRLVDEMQETAKGKPEEIAKVIKTMMVE